MIIIPTDAYPLAWPAGVARTGYRQRSRFENRTTGDSIARVIRELKNTPMTKTNTIIISSNLQVRQDGLPRSDGPQVPEGDPGVVVYWQKELWRKEQWTLVPYAMPCDRWNRIADNLYAIALSIEALRGMDRWGCVSVEQAFAGFAALPPGSGEQVGGVDTTPRRPWRDVLGVTIPAGIVDNDTVLAIAKHKYRQLMIEHHPDKGGNPVIASELNTALADAELELEGKKVANG